MSTANPVKPTEMNSSAGNNSSAVKIPAKFTFNNNPAATAAPTPTTTKVTSVSSKVALWQNLSSGTSSSSNNTTPSHSPKNQTGNTNNSSTANTFRKPLIPTAYKTLPANSTTRPAVSATTAHPSAPTTNAPTVPILPVISTPSSVTGINKPAAETKASNVNQGLKAVINSSNPTNKPPLNGSKTVGPAGGNNISKLLSLYNQANNNTNITTITLTNNANANVQANPIKPVVDHSESKAAPHHGYNRSAPNAETLLNNKSTSSTISTATTNNSTSAAASSTQPILPSAKRISPATSSAAPANNTYIRPSRHGRASSSQLSDAEHNELVAMYNEVATATTNTSSSSKPTVITISSSDSANAPKLSNHRGSGGSDSSAPALANRVAINRSRLSIEVGSPLKVTQSTTVTPPRTPNAGADIPAGTIESALNTFSQLDSFARRQDSWSFKSNQTHQSEASEAESPMFMLPPNSSANANGTRKTRLSSDNQANDQYAYNHRRSHSALFSTNSMQSNTLYNNRNNTANNSSREGGITHSASTSIITTAAPVGISMTRGESVSSADSDSSLSPSNSLNATKPNSAAAAATTKIHLNKTSSSEPLRGNEPRKVSDEQREAQNLAKSSALSKETQGDKRFGNSLANFMPATMALHEKNAVAESSLPPKVNLSGIKIEDVDSKCTPRSATPTKQLPGDSMNASLSTEEGESTDPNSYNSLTRTATPKKHSDTAENNKNSLSMNHLSTTPVRTTTSSPKQNTTDDNDSEEEDEEDNDFEAHPHNNALGKPNNKLPTSSSFQLERKELAPVHERNFSEDFARKHSDASAQSNETSQNSLSYSQKEGRSTSSSSLAFNTGTASKAKWYQRFSFFGNKKNDAALPVHTHNLSISTQNSPMPSPAPSPLPPASGANPTKPAVKFQFNSTASNSNNNNISLDLFSPGRAPLSPNTLESLLEVPDQKQAALTSNSPDINSLLVFSNVAFSMIQPLKGGILYKKAQSRNRWQRHLFLLAPDHHLYYFAETRDLSPLGVLNAKHCIVKEERTLGAEQSNSKRRRYCFSVLCSRGYNLHKKSEYRDRRYYFMCEAISELSDWIYVLKTSSNWTNDPTIEEDDQQAYNQQATSSYNYTPNSALFTSNPRYSYAGSRISLSSKISITTMNDRGSFTTSIDST
jgi:hypothetical protein